MTRIGTREQAEEVGERDDAQGQPGATGRRHELRSSRRWARLPPQPQHEQRDEGDGQQRHRDRGGVGRPVDLDLLLDVLRHDLRLARDVAADEHDRAVLPHRPGEGQPGAADDRRRQGRAARRAGRSCAFDAPRDAAASSTSRSSSMSTGCTERTTNGQRDEGQGDDEAPAGGVEVHPDRAVRAVEREQHDARHDRRQREGQVDERVDVRACRGTRRARAPRR